MSGLSLNCTIHYNKWNKYAVYFDVNPNPVGLRSVFNDEVIKFTGWMGDGIRRVADRANYDLDGITADKVKSKQDASDTLSVVTSNAKSFATAFKLNVLNKQMNNATSAKLFKEKDENFVSSCNSVNTILAKVLVDYPVDALNYFDGGQLSDAMALVSDFEGKLGFWTVKETDVNNAKIEFELEWMPKVNDSLVYMEGLLPGQITTKFPTFVKGFITLKKLVRAGVKDQGVLATMEDAVTAELFINTGKMETLNYDGAQKILMTNNLGLFKLMRLKIGVWKIKFSSPGYVDQIITVTVKFRKVVKVEILLVKEVVAVVAGS